jgi:hypothetical protein
MPRLSLLPLCAALAAPQAFASSDEAWAVFRAEVEAACRALVTEPGEVAIEVNPFGSQSYGVALVRLTTATGEDRMVCIYDKAARIAELTAPFQPEPISL